MLCSFFFALSYSHLRTWSRDATVIGLKIQHNELMSLLERLAVFEVNKVNAFL